MEIERGEVVANDHKIGFRSCGEGPPVLLVHGWPTSSFLWRNVMPAMAADRRVIAVDLPGFGASDKPTDASYSFRFFGDVLDAFVEQLEIDEPLGLAVHDLGGPVGLWWAARSPDRIERIAILNTLVYPEISLAVKLFVASARLPLARRVLTSQWGLARALRFGVADPARLRDDAMAGFCAPFRDRDARAALARAGCGLHPDGLKTVGEFVDNTSLPLRIRLRHARSDPARHRRDRRPRPEGAPRGGGQRAGLRSLPAGGTARGDRRVARGLLLAPDPAVERGAEVGWRGRSTRASSRASSSVGWA